MASIYFNNKKNMFIVDQTSIISNNAVKSVSLNLQPVRHYRHHVLKNISLLVTLSELYRMYELYVKFLNDLICVITLILDYVIAYRHFANGVSS